MSAFLFQALKTAIARVMGSCHHFFDDIRQYFITCDFTRLKRARVPHVLGFTRTLTSVWSLT